MEKAFSRHEHPGRCTVLIDEVFQSPTAQKLLTKQFVQSAKFGLKFVLTLHKICVPFLLLILLSV